MGPCDTLTHEILIRWKWYLQQIPPNEHNYDNSMLKITEIYGLCYNSLSMYVIFAHFLHGLLRMGMFKLINP